MPMSALLALASVNGTLIAPPPLPASITRFSAVIFDIREMHTREKFLVLFL